MRVNIYAEEMTNRIELVSKTDNERNIFTGIRFYMYLPVTTSSGENVEGPFLHRPGDDDSAAVTFWGKTALRPALVKALHLLDTRGTPMETEGPYGYQSLSERMEGLERQMDTMRKGFIE